MATFYPRPITGQLFCKIRIRGADTFLHLGKDNLSKTFSDHPLEAGNKEETQNSHRVSYSEMCTTQPEGQD